MATHDYVLANASGASFRADLNNALAAIVSNNSNATSPATTYAYQWWADTTANQLKLRNSANDDWIVIQELDGTMLMEDGSAASPGLSFASDLNTGLFRPAANQLGIATSGVERVEFGTTQVVFNDSGADVNFRIEGDDEANLFFVDAGTNRVGIGTNGPTEILTINGNIEFESSTQAIKFAAGNSATNSIECNSGSGPRASIDFLGVGSNQSTDIVFKTAETSSTSAERMRIKTSTGNLGIGTSSPSQLLSVSGAAISSTFAGSLISAATTERLRIGYRTGGPNTGLTCAQIVEDTNTLHISGRDTTNGDIIFHAGSSVPEVMRIDAAEGFVGIGTSSPSGNLHIETGAGNFKITNFGSSSINIENSKPAGVVRHIAAGGLRFSSDSSTELVRITGTGNVGIGTTSPSAKLDVNGSLSKNSGSFKIDHPLPALAETHHLVHSFVEAPDASNLYAGMVDLVDGTATVNIDTAHRMTEGTFVALNTVQSWSSSNETGYAPVKCSISGNLLTIECQDATSTDTVYYEVRGIRKDQHMLDTEWTDENGRVITEPLKVTEEVEAA